MDNGSSPIQRQILSELMMTWCQLEPYEQTLLKFESRYKNLEKNNNLKNVVCKTSAFL